MMDEDSWAKDVLNTQGGQYPNNMATRQQLANEILFIFKILYYLFTKGLIKLS